MTSSGTQKEEISKAILDIQMEAKHSGNLTVRWAIVSIIASLVLSSYFQWQGGRSLDKMERGIKSSIKSYSDSTLMAAQRNLDVLYAQMKQDLESTRRQIVSDILAGNENIRHMEDKLEIQGQSIERVEGITVYLGSISQYFLSFETTNLINLAYKLKISSIHPELKYDDLYAAFIRYGVDRYLIPQGPATFKKWNIEFIDLCVRAQNSLSQKHGRIEPDSLKFIDCFKNADDSTLYSQVWERSDSTYEELASYFNRMERRARLQKIQSGVGWLDFIQNRDSWDRVWKSIEKPEDKEAFKRSWRYLPFPFPDSSR